MPAVNREHNKKGDFLVDYEEKVFEDVKAEPGQKALVTFHTVAFEGSIGLVNLLQATRLQRKGFDTSILLYGPGITLGVQRGFPRLGDEAFPGHLNFNNQLEKFMAEGGKVFQPEDRPGWQAGARKVWAAFAPELGGIDRIEMIANSA